MPAAVLLYRQGLPDEHRARAAPLYVEVFGGKFEIAVPNRASQFRIIERDLQLEHGIAALADGELVGLAGYATRDGTLTGGIGWRLLARELGLCRGTLAAALYALFMRPKKPGELLMDGIAVDESMRGRGVGTGLLDEIAKLAREKGLDSVRLDVIDTNPRAKQLYLRNGFEVTKVRRFEWLRGLLGFGAAETMVRRLGL